MTGELTEFYVAPLHEVGADVLEIAKAYPYLNPACPGFRSSRLQVRVVFQVSSKP